MQPCGCIFAKKQGDKDFRSFLFFTTISNNSEVTKHAMKHSFCLSRGFTLLTALGIAILGMSAIDELPGTDEYSESVGCRPTRKTEQLAGFATAFHQAPILRAKGESRTLLDEDFSKFSRGSDTAPWLDQQYGGNSDTDEYNLPEELFSSGGWQGSMLYEAGGAIALYTESYMGPILLTPEADYSGDVTVTFRAKALNGSCYFQVAFLAPDPTTGQLVYAEAETGSYNIADDGIWHDITLQTSNHSSNQGGRFQIMTYGSGVIDDLKIVSTENFVAAPEISKIYGFTQTSFSVDWSKVDVASDYKVSLTKAVVDESSSDHYENDFEFDNLSEIPSEWELDCEKMPLSKVERTAQKACVFMTDNP